MVKYRTVKLEIISDLEKVLPKMYVVEAHHFIRQYDYTGKIEFDEDSLEFIYVFSDGDEDNEYIIKLSCSTIESIVNNKHEEFFSGENYQSAIAKFEENKKIAAEYLKDYRYQQFLKLKLEYEKEEVK